MEAQDKTDSIAGEYYLRGVMETASGFKLNNDSSFEFFFSYGALDRFGKGKWHLKNGNIILNSRHKPPHDFSLITSKAAPGESVVVKIQGRNPMFVSNVFGVLKSGKISLTQMSDKTGLLKFKKYPVDSITLVLKFCPERSSVFTIAYKTHNYFMFRFEPWITEVFFQNFMLTYHGTSLSGKHPLLDDKIYNYLRSE